MTAYEWEPITDLPENWPDLHRKELELAGSQWIKERSILRDPDRLRELHERLATRWAIETGVIERLYSIDRGMTETLIELGLDALESFHHRGAISLDAKLLIEDQKATLDFIFDFVSHQRDLTSAYIKELHQSLTRHQDTKEAVDQFGNPNRSPLVKGAWKKLPNNPMRPNGLLHEYCPPDFVQDEIDRLLGWHQAHIHLGVPVDVEAAWVHHRFTQIHPFEDGNGRVARALATMIFLRFDYLPLVVRDAEHKKAYLDALEAADRGDLTDLVGLFATIEQQDIDWAIKDLRELRGEGVSRLATSAAERARLRRDQAEEETKALTERLVAQAQVRLEEVARELRLAFQIQTLPLEVFVGRSAAETETTAETETWWSRQIVETARKHGYWADLSKARSWVQIRLRLPGLATAQTNLVVSFHQKGTIAGLMAASAFMSTRGRVPGSSGLVEFAEDEFAEEWEVDVLADDPFTYSTSHREPETGFREWLEKLLDKGLDLWQSRI